MAAGDVFSGEANNLADQAEVSIQPAAGQEVILQNVYYAGAVELYIHHTNVDVLFDDDAQNGARLTMSLRMTNAHYLKVKNVSGGAIDVTFDGVVTK